MVAAVETKKPGRRNPAATLNPDWSFRSTCAHELRALCLQAGRDPHGIGDDDFCVVGEHPAQPLSISFIPAEHTRLRSQCDAARCPKLKGEQLVDALPRFIRPSPGLAIHPVTDERDRRVAEVCWHRAFGALLRDRSSLGLELARNYKPTWMPTPPGPGDRCHGTLDAKGHLAKLAWMPFDRTYFSTHYGIPTARYYELIGCTCPAADVERAIAMRADFVAIWKKHSRGGKKGGR